MDEMGNSGVMRRCTGGSGRWGCPSKPHITGGRMSEAIANEALLMLPPVVSVNTPSPGTSEDWKSTSWKSSCRQKRQTLGSRERGRHWEGEGDNVHQPPTTLNYSSLPAIDMVEPI